jgi:epoxyqueuosine reductase QueG
MLITPKYGSAVRLATVLTDMPLSRNREKLPFLCGDCTECAKACPAGAISGKTPTLNRDDFFDAEKCSHHMKTYKDIGRGAVCGLCMRACPKNKF